MKVLVYFETKEGRVINNSLELVTAGKILGDVEAVMVGADLGDAAAAAAVYGAPVVYINRPVSCQDETAALLEAQIAEGDYGAVLFPSTLEGKDLAPRLAARFGSVSVTDAVEIRGDAMIRPAYGGSVLERMAFAEGKKRFATVRGGSYAKPEAGGAAAVSEKTPGPAADKVLAAFLEKTVDITEKVDLEGASIVVAGGRGCKDAETFGLVKELAQALGAEVGASRPAIESGWVSRAHQIGQSGKMIAPKLYIACGISGAMQHISGVSNAGYIVAVNKDADAPIFEIADVGIVGRCENILPLLIQAVRERQGV